MPFTFNFDLEAIGSDDRRRINIVFERCGWESVGGSSWRYPALGKREGPDDYFGQVHPALSFFKDLVSAKGANVATYSLVADSDAYYASRPSTLGGIRDEVGHPIVSAEHLRIAETRDSKGSKLSARRLRRYLQDCENSLALG